MTGTLKAALSVSSLAIVLFGGAVAADEGDARFPQFGDARLKAGREVWLGNCKVCHATGLAGAPRIDRQEEWRPRLAKERSTLYQHALNGFFGPMGTMMPARGGNEKLSDEQVRTAVDYMTAIVAGPRKAVRNQ